MTRAPALSGPRRRNRIAFQAFTLVELLIVLAILTILMALLLPGVSNWRQRTESTICANNLKQIYLAISGYAQDHGGYYPKVKEGTKIWASEIVPYYSGETPDYAGILRAPKIQVCPTHVKRGREFGTGFLGYTYGMNEWLAPNDEFYVRHEKTVNIPQPASTLLVTEGGYAASSFVCTINYYWLVQGITYRGTYLGGAHQGANNVLWCDGHVSAFKDAKKLFPSVGTYGGPGDKYIAPGFNPFAL